MAKYLFQAAYTSDGWAAQVKNPQNRIDAIRPSIERLGGRIEQAFYAFGEYDIFAIIDFPDNVNAAAWSIAAAAGGSIKTGKTTPLMTIEEGIEAVRKASDIAYKPPTG